METKELNNQARSYFLQQGASIAKLHQILSTNLFMHHLHKWSSVVIEILLYLVFFTMLISILLIPTEPNVYFGINNGNQIGLSAHSERLVLIILFIKALFLLIDLPVLFFALLLRRNRKKNALIHEAFAEVKKMKEGFDGAVKGFGL